MYVNSVKDLIFYFDWVFFLLLLFLSFWREHFVIFIKTLFLWVRLEEIENLEKFCILMKLFSLSLVFVTRITPNFIIQKSRVSFLGYELTRSRFYTFKSIFFFIYSNYDLFSTSLFTFLTNTFYIPNYE